MPFVLAICMVCIIGAFTFFTVTDISNQTEQITSSTENNNIKTKTVTSSKTEADGDESIKDNTIAF